MGVPQRSVLGTLLFTLYISPIKDIIMSHCLLSASYADDNQVYITITPSARNEFSKRLESFLNDLSKWYTTNLLKSNPQKTKFIHFSSKLRPCSNIPHVFFVRHQLLQYITILNLGVKIDRHLSLKDHIADICRKASFSINRIAKIRNYLDRNTTERLIRAFVSSRLD